MVGKARIFELAKGFRCDGSLQQMCPQKQDMLPRFYCLHVCVLLSNATINPVPNSCRGRGKNCIRIARQRVEKALQYQFKDRKRKKREFRSLWIQRINAGAKEHGVGFLKASSSLPILLVNKNMLCKCNCNFTRLQYLPEIALKLQKMVFLLKSGEDFGKWYTFGGCLEVYKRSGGVTFTSHYGFPVISYASQLNEGCTIWYL
jgi:ribosomal protein L20